MMLEDSATAKHNRGECRACGLEWSGPESHIEASFHRQITGHHVTVLASVRCPDGCCDD